jgi:hypothetical protein
MGDSGVRGAAGSESVSPAAATQRSTHGRDGRMGMTLAKMPWANQCKPGMISVSRRCFVSGNTWSKRQTAARKRHGLAIARGGWVILAFAVASVATAGVAGDTFDRFFTDGTLRVDIVHSGTAQTQNVSVRRIVREPVWAGPRVIRPEVEGLGTYRVDVMDDATQRVIYRHGFSTLFAEWQTTEEAKTTRKAFEETLETPFPKGMVDVVMYARNDRGEMDELFRLAVDPQSYLVGRLAHPPLDAGAEVSDVELHGAAEDKVDLVVLGDGYQAAEKEKFRRDCSRFAEKLFGAEPFHSMRDRFNIRAVFVPSRDCGVREPRKGIYPETPFGLTFSAFDLPRYCMTERYWAIRDAVAAVPHDAILLMANSSRYGGGAIYNYYTVFVSDNEYDDYLVVHEFGHGFGGLGDEYYSSSVAYNEFYPRGVEPWEPNITALLDPPHVKWQRFVESGTPIPTPAGDSTFAHTVGAFEGAGYAAKGLYRPALDCKMFSKGNKPFCPVCAHALEDVIRSYARD